MHLNWVLYRVRWNTYTIGGDKAEGSGSTRLLTFGERSVEPSNAHQPGRGQKGRSFCCKEEGYYGYFGGHDISSEQDARTTRIAPLL